MSVTVEKITYKKFTWVDVHNPDEATLAQLAKKHKFHQLDIEDVLTGDQRTKIDDYDSYLFLVLHFPYFDKKKKSVREAKVSMFLSTNFLITLHDGEVQILKKFVREFGKSLKLRRDNMGKGMGYLMYEILDAIFDEIFPILNKISSQLRAMEDGVFSVRSTQHDLLKDIIRLKKDLLTLQRTISPLRTVMPQLEYRNKKFIPEGLDIYFDDTVDKVEKLWAMTVSDKELLDLIQDTNEAIISHTTNYVIKVLTVFSVIMLPITFITGFFGMNVTFPHALGDDPLAYLWITGGMFGIVIAMLVFFKMKRWM